MDTAKIIESGKTALGIEFGSTRIKAVLTDNSCNPIASGDYEWENQFENGIWTYSLDEIWKGLQGCYASLLNNVKEKFGVVIKKIGVIGFSGMMHGYMPFDKNGDLLVNFRTWRNSITEEASKVLTEKFNFNIPQRWSVAHLYQSIINKEEHINKIDYFTTLAGFIHWKLTGEKVLGIGEASGMFPIDSKTKNYNTEMIEKFNSEIKEYEVEWKIEDILPRVLVAGETAGKLTVDGAKLLDISGNLECNIPVCPPEGDASTGMVATNSVAVRTGNISAGTSIFSMVVLERELSKVYPEIDLVTTPVGDSVGMVHCNNCTSDINAWVNLFSEFAGCLGNEVEKGKLFTMLFQKALEGEKDCSGLMSYNYLSGENITGLDEGRPLFVRSPKANFTLSNFMRAILYSALSTLKIGMDIMTKTEGVKIDKLYGHGGFFKTKNVGQKLMAAAMDSPVSIMETAGEGGAWGIAILACYSQNKGDGEKLDEYLKRVVFAGKEGSSVEPNKDDVMGFDSFIKEYVRGLEAEKAAVKVLFKC